MALGNPLLDIAAAVPQSLLDKFAPLLPSCRCAPLLMRVAGTS